MSTQRNLVPIGTLAVTVGVSLECHPAEVFLAIIAHSQGYWGEISEEDYQMNVSNLADGGRIMSVQTGARTGTVIYIITEADRTLTTVMLPDEY